MLPVEGIPASMNVNSVSGKRCFKELQRRYKVYFGDTLTYRVIEALAQDIACGLLYKEVALAGLRKSALMNLFRAEALDEYIGSLPL